MDQVYRCQILVIGLKNFFQCLLIIFINHIYQYKPQGKILIILDGHPTHCKDPEILEEDSKVGIETLCLTPHSTHKFQPLDVSYFKSLKQYYNEACRKFVREYPGKNIMKENFVHNFKTAWDKATTVGNIVNGFRKCGTYPFNPGVKFNEIESEINIIDKEDNVPII